MHTFFVHVKNYIIPQKKNDYPVSTHYELENAQHDILVLLHDNIALFSNDYHAVCEIFSLAQMVVMLLPIKSYITYQRSIHKEVQNAMFKFATRLLY